MNSMMKKARKIMALLILSVMVLTMGIPVGVANAQSTAADIQGHWAKAQITDWMEKGFVKGYPDGTFKPNNGITRAEFSVLVNKSFDLTETTSISFKDVKENDWFYAEIAKAKKAGYLGGYEDGTVKPNAPITRQEVATIVAKLRGLESNASAANKFTDAAKIADWSKGFVGAVVEAKYMGGYPDGTFMPTKGITRAEAVVALNNVVGKVETPVVKEDKVVIKEISKQTVKIDRTEKVTVKVEPKDAKISMENSDEKIVKATLKDTEIELKGIKEGKAKITVTAKKDGLKDAEITFEVVVERYSSGGGGGHHDDKTSISVTAVDAINGSVTVTFSKEVTTVPKDLAVLKDGKTLTLSADKFKVANGKVVITVPVVEPTTQEQKITYGVKIGNDAEVKANSVVIPKKDDIPGVKTLKGEILSENIFGATPALISVADVTKVTKVTKNGVELTKEEGYIFENGKVKLANASKTDKIVITIDSVNYEVVFESTLAGEILPENIFGATPVLITVPDVTKVTKVTKNGAELIKEEGYIFDNGKVKLANASKTDKVVITIDGVEYSVLFN